MLFALLLTFPLADYFLFSSIVICIVWQFLPCITWTLLFCLQRLRAASNLFALSFIRSYSIVLKFWSVRKLGIGVCNKVLKLNLHFINYSCLYSAHSILSRVMPIFFFFSLLLSRNVHLCTCTFCYVYKIGFFFFFFPWVAFSKGNIRSLSGYWD